MGQKENAEKLIGFEYGRLKVIGYDREKSKKYREMYLICQCICGSPLRSVALKSLKNGITKSCGCYISELISKKHKKYNIYDLTGEYGIGYTTKGNIFTFDLKHYDKIKDICWHEKYIKNRYYIIGNNKGKNILIHRLITGAKTGEVVDHINGSGSEWDNRENNLRICTTQENNRNKTQVKGVTFNKALQKFKAYIGYNKKKKHLGYFDTEEEAIEVRRKAEKEYFGEFAPIRE